MGWPIGGIPSESLRTIATTLLISLTTGAASSAYGFGEYDRVEKLFISTMSGAVGGSVMVSPRHSAESFMQLMTWFVISHERALSLLNFVRTCGAFFTITKLQDWTKSSEVKAHIANLVALHGLESVPMTHGTRRMLQALLRQVIPQRKGSGIIRARMRLLLVLEAVAGLRVGEATGGGDNHGLLANNVCILRRTDTGAVSVEGRLEHSKTKRVRWFNLVGVTETSRVDVAHAFAAYWAEVGIATSTSIQGLYQVTRPDYWVVRVSLLGMLPRQVQALKDAQLNSSFDEVRKMARYHIEVIGRRATLQHDAEAKAYVCLMGGRRTSSIMARFVAELRQAGFGAFISMAEGPLLRSTSGTRMTNMGLSPTTTYGQLGAAMETAYALANRPGDPDPELDLAGAKAPKWGNHSWRRFADKVARQTKATTLATDVDIDRFFGWLEAQYEKMMALAYMGREERSKRSRVTMMV